MAETKNLSEHFIEGNIRSPFSSFYIEILELNEMKEVTGSIKELMLKLLFDLGLTETEVAVYVFLTKKGPQKAGVIGNALNLYKQRLYRSLRKMQRKGVIEASGYPACFSAMPFEKVLDLVVKSNIEEAERMIQNKEELLSTWQSITHNNSEKLTSGKKRGHSKKWNNKTRS